MAILHGSWLLQNQGGCLFIWGETWRSLLATCEDSDSADVPKYPLAMTAVELVEWCRNQNFPIGKSLQQSDNASGPARKGRNKSDASLQAASATKQAQMHQSCVLALPTHITANQAGTEAAAISPIHSATLASGTDPTYLLQPWLVEGLCLDPLEAIKFLTSLPLGTTNKEAAFLGGDLNFWSQIARWSLDLLSRCKFLPTLNRQTDGSLVAGWRSLLDSAVDSSRLEKFAQMMPAACRTYQVSAVEEAPNRLDVNLPLQPQELLLGFLNSTIDAQVRAVVSTHPLPTVPVAPVQEWLQALGQVGNTLKAPAEVERLEAALNAWTAPLQYQLAVFQSLFRTCFYLHPPASGETDWTLAYFLQAADAPEFLVDAATIWNHPVERWVTHSRTIEQPQETLLRGLGLASLLYAPIEYSLQQPYPTSCRLSPLQAYEFLKSIAPRFEDSGLGVVLPPSLANREGWANRLGLKISAQTLQQNGHLGLQSLLNSQWELAIGGQTLSKAEFDRLVALNSPLVEINGEWVELRSQDIKAAQAFFAANKDKLAVSLEDALRLSTGNSQVIEKLPVVSFEASGAIHELMATLTNNQAIAPHPTPESFQGQLRPYQARGVNWLSFLERWGLGACLADDMGLGKCTSADSLIAVNGTLQTAEEIWDAYAGELEFDGEGFWATPTKPLLVNAIDEKTGQIVQAPIRRLYQQRVQEKLRRITLQDGSSITITRRHQLLTSKGWTNNLQVGDYVCVPAKMLWDGQPEDPDLVKFLAWQIAEGYEQSDRAAVFISQKDQAILKDLLQTFQRIGQRYSLKINRPAIRTFIGKVPVLRVNSQAYQRFLEAKGYCWGKLSREKSIPPFIMQADLDSVRLFLRHYFNAESAVVHSMRSVEIATVSPLLIQQLSLLLRRFGIWLRISPKQKRATNGSGIFRTYYIGVLGGNSARRFMQEIGFTNPDKQQKLEKICESVSNSNVEGIPASDIVAQSVKATGLPVRHFGMHNTVYINGPQQFSRGSLERVLVGFNRNLTGEAEQEYRQLHLTKWTVQTLEAYERLDVQHLIQTRQSLQRLLDQEVFYCKIETIEDVEYEGWVYDFEVSKHHNFVANNILCHNTIQFIAFMLQLKEQEALEQPALLVCPTSVLGNWEREVKKFGPILKVLMHHGDKRSKGKAFTSAVKSHDLVVTSYALIQRDVKELQSVSWQGVVLDEAQNIKNPEAKQSQAIRQLQSSFRIALTGTPVENRLQELWSILDFLNPGYLGSRQFFQRRFAMPIEKYGDVASLQTLRSLVQPFILRRLKTDREIIQDLPEKQEMTVFCSLSAQQAALYQRVVEESLAEIESAEGVQRRGMILALLVKLKQICNHPAQYLKENTLSSQHPSGKLQRLTEMLEVALSEGDRALIFTQFAEWGKLLKPYLEKHLGREMLFLYGSTSKKQREEMIDRFQHDPQGPPIMILSLKAGGVGLNLTRANHVFHFDRWWNPAVENQATDRVFRIGQTRNVQVHKFVCTGTLEEKIHEMIESKKALAEQVVGAGEQWLTEMDTNQLRNLLLLDRNAVIDEEE